MQKIVINDCYGGFSLSPEGLEEYAKLKGIEKLYWFEYDFDLEKLTSIQRPNKVVGALLAYTIPNPDNKTTSFSNRDIPRDDPKLVEVVEKLSNKANGCYAELSVIEIPDDVEWTIEEHDGVEWISEKHRTWS